MDEEMMALFNELSDDVRSLLLVENPDGSYKINGNNFQNALDKSASVDEENKVIEIFLKNSLATDSKWKGLTWDRIEPYKDILIRICSELGLKELQNPFLVFLPEFYRQNPNADLTRDNMIDLNNLYATDELTREDLLAKGRNGSFNIIFDSNLYANENVDKMVEYWNWLYNDANRSRMNWQEVLTANLTNAINDVAESGGVSNDATPVINKLFYINGNDGKTNSQATIEKLLSAGSIGMGKQKSTQNKNTQNATVLNSLKSGLVKYGKQYNLTEVELKALLNDVLDELGL